MAFLLNWFVKITGAIPALIVFRTKYYFEDRAVQGRRIRGRAIVASNHTALTDFASNLFAFPLNTLRCAVAEVMFNKGWLMNGFLRALGAIRVDRDVQDFSFLARAQQVLDGGGVVEIFPESRLPDAGDARPLPFKPSAVYLALITDTPIIPVYTNGEYYNTRRHKVVIGKPIRPTELYDSALGEKENVERITEILRGKIIELEKIIEE